MFDTMAQQLFNLARVPALRDLMECALAHRNFDVQDRGQG
jgi:hypothetical protein